MRRVAGFAIVMTLVVGSLGYWAGTANLLAPSQSLAADDCQMFSQTGFQVCGDFLAYWNGHGGLAQQGYPVSPTFQEKSDTDGKTYIVQYFERAVFEAHPENATPNNVLLSLLGSQKYQTKYAGKPPAGASAAPPASAASPVTAPQSSGATPNGTHLRLATGQTATAPADGSVQRITIVKLTDNAKSTNQFNMPKAGNKFVQLEFVMEDVGQKDTTSGSWKMQAVDGFEYDIGNAAGFGENMTFVQLSPGGKKQGSVVFEVPQAAAVKWLRYRANDGLTQTDIFFDA